MSSKLSSSADRRARCSVETRWAVLVNISSSRPSLKNWVGSATAPFGNFSTGGLQGTASVRSQSASRSASAPGTRRASGYTVNTVTGNDLDSRSAFFSKTQLLWTPSAALGRPRHPHDRARARRRLRVERPGGAAGDAVDRVARLRGVHPPRYRRPDPAHQPRRQDDRLLVRRPASCGGRRTTSPTSTTRRSRCFAAPTRKTTASSRRSSASPRRATRRAGCPRNRDAALAGGAVLLQPGLHAGRRELVLAVRAVAVPAVRDRSALPAGGARRPRRRASTAVRRSRSTGGSTRPSASAPITRTSRRTLSTFFSPAVRAGHHRATPPAASTTCRRSSRCRTGCSRTTRCTARRRGASRRAASTPPRPRAANPTAQEHSWNYEGGVKTSWLAQRLSVNAAVFYIDWTDLQVNVPNPFVPAQFYVANAGTRDEQGLRGGAERAAPARPRRVCVGRPDQRPVRRRERVGRRGRQRERRWPTCRT